MTTMTIINYQNVFHSLKPEQVFAGQYLESNGLRFGVDFGTSDAIRKATALVIEGLEEMDMWDRFGYGV